MSIVPKGPDLAVFPGQPNPNLALLGTPSSNPDNKTPVNIPGLSGNFQWTEGWWVTLFCLVGVASANTRFGPVMFGIIGVAIIYQGSLLLQGK